MLKVFIFDFGDVLYRYDKEEFNKGIKDLLSIDDTELEILAKGIFIDYMIGKCSTVEFTTYLSKCNEEIQVKDVENLFIRSFSKDKKMYAILPKLKNKYKLGLLTDTGPIPYKLFMKDDLIQYFDAVTLSYEIGHKKPSKEMYNDILLKLNCGAEECLFIDDKEKNVKAAEELGMLGYTFVNYEDFVSYLKSTGFARMFI